jgi:hypothetical protein
MGGALAIDIACQKQKIDIGFDGYNQHRALAAG